MGVVAVARYPVVPLVVRSRYDGLAAPSCHDVLRTEPVWNVAWSLWHIRMVLRDFYRYPK